MGEFNSDDHSIYYCGKESLRRNEVDMIVNKTIQNAVLWYNFKNNRMISVRFQGKPFNITVIQVYTQTSICWRSWSWTALWRPTRPFRTNTHNVLSIIGDWNTKVGSRETPGVMEIWPWSTEWSRAKTNRVLPRECTGHSKYPLPTTQ